MTTPQPTPQPTPRSAPTVPALTGEDAPAPLPLRTTLYAVAAVQAILGVGFVAAPAGIAHLLGLPPAPAWTGWLFAQMGARFLGYAVGMAAAARDPRRHRLWITTMIAVQGLDWTATIIHLMAGDVTLAQVTTAPFLPAAFIAGLLVWYPGRSRRRAGRMPVMAPR